MTETDALPPCPACAEEYAYEDGALLVCPMCGHEWSPESEAADRAEPAPAVVKDAVGNPLADGDDVTIAKDLKVKGGSTIKSGTKVRGIRLLDAPVDGHDISAKVPGQGQMYLKSSVVKRA